MVNMPHNAAAIETRRRLIEAAGEVFADRGYRDATVREICSRAQANLAAVGYHFRDKQGLYDAVLEHAHGCARAGANPSALQLDELDPRVALRLYIHEIIKWMFLSGAPAWLTKIMAREMAEPTPSLSVVVESSIRPAATMLGHLLRRVLGPNADDDLVWRCGFSVMGQILFYKHSRPVIELLNPNQGYDEKELQLIAEHVSDFCLGGLDRLRKQLDAQSVVTRNNPRRRTDTRTPRRRPPARRGAR